MITANQRKRLENAGYTISKSGKAVLTQDGATVGGYNSNGKLFSGSDTVTKILKGKEQEVEERRAKPKAKPKAKSRAPAKSKRPMRRTGKLNDDAKAARTNASTKSNKTLLRSSSLDARKPRKVKWNDSDGVDPLGTDNNRVIREKFSNVTGGRGDGIYETDTRRWDKLELFKKRWKTASERVKKQMWTSLSEEERRELNLPIKNLTFSSTTKMNKGGLVDRRKGLFSSSASPRGYK